jgi:hypothetical protein
MRQKLIILLAYIFLASWLSSLSLLTLAQIPGMDSTLISTDLLNEKIRIFTDRSIYAAGEKIFFRIYNLSDPVLKESSWSKILYVELIDPGNNSPVKGKFPLEQWGSHGYITIPSNLRTGNYYLRVYTKWMRNYSPFNYSYSVITIINPYNEEMNEIFKPGIAKDTISNRYISKINVIKNFLKCSTGQEKYEKRKKVTLTFEMPDKTMLSPGGFCISVIKSGATRSNIYGLDLSDLERKEISSGIKFYPEIKGISLSGRIVKKDLNIPSAYAEVHLSAPGDHPDYFGYLTDMKGKFFFSLPGWHETRNFFIGVETKDEDPVEILIDNDFSTDLMNLPPIPFILSVEEKNIAREIMFNMQLEKAYKQKPHKQITDTLAANSNIDVTAVNPESVFFYGNPAYTLYPADFVDLPSLEEFFLELIPQASVVKRKEGTKILMKGNNPDISIYKPLILLDFIPVFNPENLLKISPESIHRIDIINATYIRGNMCFGGIISILSKKGDMAGIDLPENSLFFDFKTFEPQDEIAFPVYSSSAGNKRIPDFRNTMYWNPVVHGNPGQTISYDFYTSDNTGDYIVIIRGISKEGTILEGHCSFTVE